MPAEWRSADRLRAEPGWGGSTADPAGYAGPRSLNPRKQPDHQRRARIAAPPLVVAHPIKHPKRRADQIIRRRSDGRAHAAVLPDAPGAGADQEKSYRSAKMGAIS